MYYVVGVNKGTQIRYLWGGPTVAERYFLRQRSRKATKRTDQKNPEGVPFFQYDTKYTTPSQQCLLIEEFKFEPANTKLHQYITGSPMTIYTPAHTHLHTQPTHTHLQFTYPDPVPLTQYPKPNT